MSEWRDSTGYRRGGERIQNAWTRDFGSFRISVMTDHVVFPGKWVMHCHPWFDTYALGAAADEMTPPEAQAKAVAIVRKKLAAALASLGDAP